ncbi:MAG: Lrp/AsnC family transcriptional regulator [Nanoarchaeota archaeon]|nr:Lrp/AsnC family transcriptional regulator [Nanoarchaeota archaeon]
MRITRRDLKILRLLEKKGGASVKDISAATGVPISTVFRKRKQFETEGIIKGYRAILSPERIGEPFTVLFYINTSEDDDGRSVAQELKKFGELKELIHVQSNWNIIAICRTETLKYLNDLNEKIKVVPGVQEVRSELVLDREYL